MILTTPATSRHWEDQTNIGRIDAMSDFAAIQSALERAWTLETSSKWSSGNPARGQCSVTAFVVQHTLGGEIVKTNVDGEWHFYNLIGCERQDFSAKQFPEAVFYADLPSGREVAFSIHLTGNIEYCAISCPWKF